MARKLWTSFVLFIYSVIPNVCASSPPTFNMHYLCGRRTLAEQFTEWKGGFLIFDSNLLPADHENECYLYIQVEAYSSYHSPGILFSFSEWEMEGDCDHTNLTIVDGDDDELRRSQDYPPTSVQDLENPICGSSPSLSLSKGTVYASTDSVLTLIFKRKKHYWGSYKTKFNMTFLAYFEGPCDAYENTFECSNDRCIDKQFVCLNLNPCGDESDCSASWEEAKTFWDNVQESIKQLAWIIVIAVGAYFVIKFLQIHRRRHGGFENLPIIGWFFKKSSRHSAHQEREPSISSLRIDHSTRRGSVVMETRSLSQSSVSSDEESPPDPSRSRTTSLVLNRNESGLTDTDATSPPPSYHELPPTAPSTEPEIPPPPSYDEVMTNNDKYIKDSDSS